MTDLNDVLSIARGLSLSESTVDSQTVLDSMVKLKAATLGVDDADASLAKWLSDEHYAGGVFIAAATMNKRAEVSGKGDPFNRQSRDVLIGRYNDWAAKFVQRIEKYQAGDHDVRSHLARLARFREDPINNEP